MRWAALVGRRVRVLSAGRVIAVGVLGFDVTSSVPWFVTKDDGSECAVWGEDDLDPNMIGGVGPASGGEARAGPSSCPLPPRRV